MGREAEGKKSKRKASRDTTTMSEDAAAAGPSGRGLPAHLAQQRDYVTCGPDMNYNMNTMTSANVYMPLGVDNAWDFSQFARDFQVEVNSYEGQDMEFDMIGVDPGIANALRRILIAEVPTMAVEHVFVINNTSLIADEVLAHRLGLVPIKADASMLEYRTGEGVPNEKNTIVLKLKADCKRVSGEVVGDRVLSGQLQWLPQGSELPDETSCRFASDQREAMAAAVEPMHDDILLAKMRPGQSIELEAHCVKALLSRMSVDGCRLERVCLRGLAGIGQEHAKWSPVATAWYRLHPELHLLQDVRGEMAEELVQQFPKLFELEDGAARVTSARGNEIYLERIRRMAGDDRWKGILALRKRKDRFIFTIQSTGVMPPEDLFTQAVDVLAAKCDTLLARL